MIPSEISINNGLCLHTPHRGKGSGAQTLFLAYNIKPARPRTWEKRSYKLQISIQGIPAWMRIYQPRGIESYWRLHQQQQQQRQRQAGKGNQISFTLPRLGGVADHSGSTNDQRPTLKGRSSTGRPFHAAGQGRVIPLLRGAGMGLYHLYNRYCKLATMSCNLC